MFIAHLPAGYLVSQLAARRLVAGGDRRRTLAVAAGMAGAVAPDLDLFYLYLVDHARHHHHTYWSHLPVTWGSLIALAALAYCLSAKHWIGGAALLFAINGFGHLLLDSIVGDIWWFGPWVDRSYSLLQVRSVHKPWWLNFILNPSFVLEIVLVWLALKRFANQKQQA